MRKSQLAIFEAKDDDFQLCQQLIFQFETDSSIYESCTDQQVLMIIFLILNKSSYHRTQNEIHILKRATLHNNFFQSLVKQTSGEYLWERCLRRMSYQYVPTGQYLFREGDKGTTFYVILSGKVMITKKMVNSMNTDQFQEREIASLSDGQYFGELALENDAPRSASVRASYPTHLAVLTAEDYMVIHKNFKNQQRSLYYEEFAKLNIFQDWKFLSIKATFDCVKEHKLGINHQVYREGDQSADVYFIHSGEFKVIKHLKNNGQVDPGDKDDLEFLIEQFAHKKGKQSNQEKIEELFQKKKYGSLFQTEKKQIITLKFLGSGEMFGEFEILQPNDLQRQFTVISTQESNRVYSIAKKDFLRVLYNDPQLNNTLKMFNEIKMKQILSQIKVYEKNFIDQSDKRIELERTQNRDYLNPQYLEDEILKTSKSMTQKITSRRRLIDIDDKEVGLTLDQHEADIASATHKHSQAQHLRQKTAEQQVNYTPKKIQMLLRRKKETNTVLGVRLGSINVPMLRSPPKIINDRESPKRVHGPQIFFKSSLPLVLQNNYIRLKSKRSLF